MKCKSYKLEQRLVTEEELIAACRKQQRNAQEMLFNRFSPVMFGVCKRYLKNREDAEDVLIEAFYKVLTNIDQYKGQGSFEGWIRRVVVNEALMFLRRRSKLKYKVEIEEIDLPKAEKIESQLAAQDIMKLLDALPMGYRTVFNLYVIEGYKHREIADMLGISINTSKSQLILAKKRLKELIEKAEYPGSE